MAGQLRRPCPRVHALADCLGNEKREDGRLFTPGAMARKKDRYARVATINGCTITVQKDGGYTSAGSFSTSSDALSVRPAAAGIFRTSTYRH